MWRKWRTDSSKIQTCLGVALVMLIFAVSSLSAIASSIAQGFKTNDSNVVSGAIVGLETGTANTVELSTSQNVDRLLGVAGTDSLIELSNTDGVVQVVTSGEALTLVSDINGSIKTGDKITASPISGVGMKALVSTLIIGTAQGDFANAKTETRTVTDKNGNKQTVRIGTIPVQVDKVFYELPQDANSFLPPAVLDFAAGVAGHPVSSVRIMAAALLVVLLVIIITILLYSAVRSSIISIGRNPLSQSAVQKSLLDVGLTVAGILIFSTIVIYLILTI